MTLFTGNERDAETGLDYFGARYLSSARRDGGRALIQLLRASMPRTPKRGTGVLTFTIARSTSPIRTGVVLNAFRRWACQ